MAITFILVTTSKIYLSHNISYLIEEHSLNIKYTCWCNQQNSEKE